MKLTGYWKGTLMSRLWKELHTLFKYQQLLIHKSWVQLQIIFQALPEKRQTLLFSATITDTLNKLREVALNKVSKMFSIFLRASVFASLTCLTYKQPFMWSAPVETATVEELDQRYILVPADFKDGYLVHVVQNFREEKPKGSIIVFTDTCRWFNIF